jgi:hypothetical protein
MGTGPLQNGELGLGKIVFGGAAYLLEEFGAIGIVKILGRNRLLWFGHPLSDIVDNLSPEVAPQVVSDFK